MTDFTNRIQGTEMEWGAMKAPHKKSDELVFIEAQDLTHHAHVAVKNAGIEYPPNQALGQTTDFFLSNGSRFYKDMGRWEYATPEDESFLGTTANEFASEEILQGMAESYADSTKHKISITKRVIDDRYVSSGYHVSYCVDATKMSIDRESLELFGVFAAARGVLFGSGALMPGGKFLIAQKAATTNLEFSSGTVNNTKPVVNLRPEHLANEDRFLRMHDTSSDPSISPWANRVKLGAGSLVLRLIEHGVVIPELRFKHSLSKVSNEIARDESLKKRYELLSGRSISALDIHQVLVNQVYKLSKETALSSDEEWTLEEWSRAISDMKQNPALTITRVEWAARRKFLERYQNKHGVAWDSEKLRYVDIQFSEIALSGIAKRLRETIWADYMPPESLINERVTHAPDTTRAHVRSEFIKIARQHRYGITATWERVRVDTEVFNLLDPYVSTHPELERLRNPS